MNVCLKLSVSVKQSVFGLGFGSVECFCVWIQQMEQWLFVYSVDMKEDLIAVAFPKCMFVARKVCSITSYCVNFESVVWNCYFIGCRLFCYLF